MTEDEARAVVSSLVDGAGYRRLEQLATLVIEENERQNLIAGSTVSVIWSRHILDSVQLLRWGNQSGQWVDIGTGGGFPGLAIAAATGGEVILVEPRRLRATFLSDAAAALGLRQTIVECAKIEAVRPQAGVISARAVAPIGKLLRAAAHCATPATRWLILRGRLPPDELAALNKIPGMMFHVEHSLSDPSSSVVIADGRTA